MVGCQGVVRRAREPARRPPGLSHRAERRPDRQSSPARNRLPPTGAVAVLLAALGLGGLLALGPRALGLLSMIGAVGFVLGVAVLALMKRVDAIRGRATRPVPGADWRDARERFDRLRGEYAGYECDPIRVLRLPALADVTVPSTARFVDALAEAQGLQTDEHPGELVAARFTTAVEHAEQAWLAARGAAGRIRLSTLDPAERAGVERVLKLLTTARHTDSEHERVIAYTRARAALAELGRAGAVHVPLPAQAALDEAARGALPG